MSEPGVAMAPGAPDPGSPSFDTVRVEPNGDIVVAGRATPNGTVELMVNGKPTATAAVDANGQFAIVPPALPSGNSEVGLRVTDGKGIVRQSRDSVAVAVAPSHDAEPLVALTSPDKPTVVLSQPGSSRTATRSVPDAASTRRTTAGTASPTRQGSGEVAPRHGASNPIGDGSVPSSQTGAGDGPDARVSDRSAPDVIGSRSPEGPRAHPPERAVVTGSAEAPTKVVSVDAQEGGRLYVSGQAPAGATVRLYLNDTMIAPATVGRDGSVTFTIGRGVKPGDYKVRLDQVDVASGKVRSRVEVPFSVPEAGRTAGTDRLAAAQSEAAPGKGDGGKMASNASPSAAAGRQRADEVASDGLSDTMSRTPATEPSLDTVRDPRRPGASAGTVYVPEVRTARIERGDSLWAISRRAYGEGDRYTAIYDANQDQIRDPDLIYPGQVFVLPTEDAIDDARDARRG